MDKKTKNITLYTELEQDVTRNWNIRTSKPADICFNHSFETLWIPNIPSPGDPGDECLYQWEHNVRPILTFMEQVD